MWFALAVSIVWAAPPSSALSGPTGTLSWTVNTTADGLEMVGVSPKWQVTHQARADFTPIRTIRRDPDGRTVRVEYTATGAVVTLPDKTITHETKGLWDGDTLDIRLGQRVVEGRPEVTFSAIDTGSGKIYGFSSQKIGDETCGSRACTHLRVQLTGLYRLVGPSFDYWYAANGQLLRFEGPAGSFSAP